MKNKQEAEREEQQRIKNHILNLDLQDPSTDNAGTAYDIPFSPFQSPNPNLSKRRTPQTPKTTLVPLDTNNPAHNDFSEGMGASEKHQHNPSLGRASSNNAAKAADKSSSNRRGDRARKLQLSDVDWYDQKPGSLRNLEGYSFGPLSGSSSGSHRESG